MTNLYFDIETIPSQDASVKQSFIDDAVNNFKAPTGLTKEQAAKDLMITDPDKIKFTNRDSMIEMWCDKFKDQHASSVGEENWLKTSFDGLLGHIVCISFAVDDFIVESISCDKIENEKSLLFKFFSQLESIKLSTPGQIRFIGHNIFDFDMRFLFHRAIVLGVTPPECIPFNCSPYDERVYDTMRKLGGDKRISLDKACNALGFSGKEGLDGSMVWPYWKDGRLQEIKMYCENDVEITRKLYKRMTFNFN